MSNWVLRMTHKLWNRQISRILCRAYEDRVINSEQLHVLCAAFDPTQDHKVYGMNARRGFSRKPSAAKAAGGGDE